jgi:dTDP-4-amino-4,6-dideoxygalactose transaminase
VLAKRVLAEGYADLLKGSALQFVTEPEGCRSNYWLNAVICEDRAARDELLKATNEQQVMTRPIWTLMSSLPMYAACRRGDLSNAEWLEQRVVNLPSSVSAEMLR